MNIDIGKYVDGIVDWIVDSGPKVVIILVLMYIGVKLSSVVSTRLFAFLGRQQEDG